MDVVIVCVLKQKKSFLETHCPPVRQIIVLPRSTQWNTYTYVHFLKFYILLLKITFENDLRVLISGIYHQKKNEKKHFLKFYILLSLLKMITCSH